MSKVSAKSVIEEGIIKGRSVKIILSSVTKKIPDSNADESHVRFYANKLVREGKLKESIASEKYGCGKRGRKATTEKTVVKKTTKKAGVKKTAKKKVASKKSVKSKKKKA